MVEDFENTFAERTEPIREKLKSIQQKKAELERIVGEVNAMENRIPPMSAFEGENELQQSAAEALVTRMMNGALTETTGTVRDCLLRNVCHG